MGLRRSGSGPCTALACDRRKAGDCRPAAVSVLPAAAAALRGDASARIRAMPVELIGTWGHAHPERKLTAIELAWRHAPLPARAAWQLVPIGRALRREGP